VKDENLTSSTKRKVVGERKNIKTPRQKGKAHTRREFIHEWKGITVKKSRSEQKKGASSGPSSSQSRNAGGRKREEKEEGSKTSRVAGGAGSNVMRGQVSDKPMAKRGSGVLEVSRDLERLI